MGFDAVFDGAQFSDQDVWLNGELTEAAPLEHFELPVLVRKGEVLSLEAGCSFIARFDTDIQAAINDSVTRHMCELIIDGQTTIGDQTFLIPSHPRPTLGQAPFAQAFDSMEDSVVDLAAFAAKHYAECRREQLDDALINGYGLID